MTWTKNLLRGTVLAAGLAAAGAGTAHASTAGELDVLTGGPPGYTAPQPPGVASSGQGNQLREMIQGLLGALPVKPPAPPAAPPGPGHRAG